ncbi:archease [Natronococcus wangiae]|uniref:archease n=1 Tax=Natronococcus wangiae TaxID=3068275 RepID=UPI00273DA4F3|nr:archease [Natronococcus sp. AD5]
MSYTILDHPADVKFRTTGTTLEEAFANVVCAVANIVESENIIDQRDESSLQREIQIEAESREALLFDFLDQLILLQDLEDAVVSHAEDLTIVETENNTYTLLATIVIRPIPSGKAFLDVKAPTYSEMRIESNDEWILDAVLDI